MSATHLLVGTRKGLAIYHKKNDQWNYETMHFSGIPVSIAYADPATHFWWACLDHGHWGVKLHRSNNQGKTWEEVAAPAFPEGSEIKEGLPATTQYIWSLQNGGLDRPGHLWLGTVPGGLFKSEDNGDSFHLVESLWEEPTRTTDWFGAGMDHPGIHSILIDPRNSDHIFVGISCAGTYESVDNGKSWTIRNKGLYASFLPDPYAEVGHDPHLLRFCEAKPEVLWQQNHCGVYRSEDSGLNWKEVSDKTKNVYFGFPIEVSKTDPLKAWIFPSKSDEERTAINGGLSVCRTDDGGQTWNVFRKGLPQEACFDIIYRHCLVANEQTVAFGTTCGNLFISEDEGASWACLNNYLPLIYSLQFV